MWCFARVWNRPAEESLRCKIPRSCVVAWSMPTCCSLMVFSYSKKILEGGTGTNSFKKKKSAHPGLQKEDGSATGQVWFSTFVLPVAQAGSNFLVDLICICVSRTVTPCRNFCERVMGLEILSSSKIAIAKLSVLFFLVGAPMQMFRREVAILHGHHCLSQERPILAPGTGADVPKRGRNSPWPPHKNDPFW